MLTDNAGIRHCDWYVARAESSRNTVRRLNAILAGRLVTKRYVQIGMRRCGSGCCLKLDETYGLPIMSRSASFRLSRGYVQGDIYLSGMVVGLEMSPNCHVLTYLRYL